MKYYLLLVLTSISCHSQPKVDDCHSMDAMDIDKETLIFPAGEVRQVDKAIHDTIATDLFLTVTGKNDQPVQGVRAEIVSVATRITDANGDATFNSFQNGPGIYTVRINYPGHGCMELTHLTFGLGIIRRLEAHFTR